MSATTRTVPRDSLDGVRASWLAAAGRAVVTGAIVALLVGSLAGAVARGFMRLFAVAAGHPGEFSWGGTLAIVLAVVVVALPGAVAAAAMRGRRRWVVPVVGALLLCVPTAGIASVEIGATADLSAGGWAGVVVTTVGVFACIAALPVLTVRLVDRRR